MSGEPLHATRYDAVLFKSHSNLGSWQLQRLFLIKAHQGVMLYAADGISNPNQHLSRGFPKQASRKCICISISESFHPQ